MKLPSALVRTFGVINAIFVLFHIWLGWRLHHMSQIQQGPRALLEIFNGCGSLPIVFLAVAGLVYPQEVISSKIGRLTLGLGSAIYLVRAALEYALSPAPSPAIAATCVLTGAIAVAAFASSSPVSSTEPISQQPRP